MKVNMDKNKKKELKNDYLDNKFNKPIDPDEFKKMSEVSPSEFVDRMLSLVKPKKTKN